ncbi:unnamed protein product [Meganyctiphanes norvegica]|uniref:Uncharacterized protein n=1 Tax=Meganyctiphanes norvegica TaxID=48144 RepID=A0AAV2QWW7_MEGNR
MLPYVVLTGSTVGTMPVPVAPCHPGPWDEWFTVDVDELTDLILVAPSRRHLLHLQEYHRFTDDQYRLWRCRWAKLSLVGDNPGVKSLAWHSVVSLLCNAPPTKCLNHEYVKSQLPSRFTRCSVHSPQRVPIKRIKSTHTICNVNCDTDTIKSNNAPNKNCINNNLLICDKGPVQSNCNVPGNLNLRSRSTEPDPIRTGYSTTCTPFTSLSTTCNFVDPPLKIPKSCCPTPESFSRGPALQYIPMLQKYPLVHSGERIAVSSFNIFDIQLDMRICKVCNKIY